MVTFEGNGWSYYDFLTHDDDQISKSYPLGTLYMLLGPGLERETARSHALPVPIQDLTRLGLLATGSLHRELADR